MRTVGAVYDRAVYDPRGHRPRLQLWPRRSRLRFLLKIDPAIENEHSGSGRGGNLAKGPVAVQVHVRVIEVGSIQEVDRIEPEFKFLGFLNPEPFNQVHVEANFPRSSNGGISESSKVAGLRVDQDHLAVWRHERFVAEAVSQP